jgi:hypothetical protein
MEPFAPDLVRGALGDATILHDEESINANGGALARDHAMIGMPGFTGISGYIP